jgi:two-component system sensor histidine kinase HydH
MLKKTKNKRFWIGVPPWIFIGAAVVLLPIFTFMTVETISRQKENSFRLLLEKGAALIRSFEAGTRTGMMEMMPGGFKLQRLLTETAQQPDIVYLFVADETGGILAHSDLSRVGEYYGRGLNLEKISMLKTVRWRIISLPDGKEIFEIYRKFTPSRRPAEMGFGRMMYHQRFMRREHPSPVSPQIIFVGLDMSSIETARKADMRHSIIMGLILLLIGFAGVILLFLAQNYQATKASLSRIKAFSDNLVDNMPIGLVAIDDHQKIASLNHVAESILGLASEKLIGKDAAYVLPTELHQLIGGIDRESGVIEKEIDCKIHEAKQIPLEVSATLLNDENGDFLGYVLLIKDLREIRGLQKEITRNQRLASVGKLAAGVAHEIRNPLSSIKGFATYFKERSREKVDDQQIANIMIQEVDRLNKVVGQLLEFARPIKISKKSIPLNGLLENSLKMIEKQAAEKNVKIETRFQSRVNTIFADPDWINQVLLNLYLNAIESMEAGGRLRVVISNSKLKNGIEITVSDTGIGMGKEDLAHIFDPYFTTKASGTGLGLAIVHNILEAHSGEIKAESTAGQGSSFTIFLPSVMKGESYA